MTHNFLVKQRGAALFVSLVILVILTIVGITAMQSGIFSERLSTNVQEQTVNFYAAQSANNTYIAEGNDLNTNVFVDTMNAPGTFDIDVLLSNTFGFSGCVDSNGNIAACGSQGLVGDNAPTKAEFIAYYHGPDCLKPSAPPCPGYSINQDGAQRMACHEVEVLGTGWTDMDNNGTQNNNEPTVNVRQFLARVGVAAGC